MSRQAIAAVLARHDLTSGERLVAFSLASFADRENRARPGTPAAAGRAGLKRSWFLEARDLLERRGLVVVEDAATGRGRASTLCLPFVDAGPWWEGEINAELFEAVLSYSRSQGTARLLLAAMAALADERRVVERVTASQLCAAAGFSDRTYRRAQAALVASGELVLRRGTGGRGNTNCWEIPDPRPSAGEVEPMARRRVAPRPGQRPLLTSVSSTLAIAAEQRGAMGGDQVGEDLPVGAGKGGQERTVSGQKRPAVAGVSGRKGGADRTLLPANRPPAAGVSLRKGGTDRTHFAETPAQTPAKTPAPNARAGKEPQNPRTVHPPSPPEGGSGDDQVFVEETYLTERGRRRRRRVPVDLAAIRARLRAAGDADRVDWEQIQAFLGEAVGESTFEIWLARLELIAVDFEGTLIVSAPPETVDWVARRFARVLGGAAQRAGRRLRVAAELERKAAEPLSATNVVAPSALPGGLSAGARCSGRVGSDARAAVEHSAVSGGVPSDSSSARRNGQSTRKPTYTSAYPSSHADVYTQTKEVS